MSLSSLPLLGPVPGALLTAFEEAFAAQQRELCRQWQLAARCGQRRLEADRSFVADELALLMNLHPQSASSFVDLAAGQRTFPR